MTHIMRWMLLLAWITLVPALTQAQPGNAAPPRETQKFVMAGEYDVAAHGNRRPREEVSPEEKAAQYARMWAAVAGAGAAAVFGVAMRKRLGRSAKGA